MWLTRRSASLSKMNYLELLHQLPQNLKIKVRQYENLCQKKIRNKWSLIFNDVCLMENIMPIYTKVFVFVVYIPYKRSGWPLSKFLLG